MVKVLAQFPWRSKHNYVLSRRPSPGRGGSMKHVAVDHLASEPNEITKILDESKVQTYATRPTEKSSPRLGATST